MGVDVETEPSVCEHIDGLFMSLHSINIDPTYLFTHSTNLPNDHAFYMYHTIHRNIALVNLKTKNTKAAIQACNYALQLNPNSVKALYLRSKARSSPISAREVEESLAIRDLEFAKQIDPLNSSVV